MRPFSTIKTHSKQLVRAVLRATTSDLTRRKLLKNESCLKDLRSALSPEDANRFISELLQSEKPFLVARLGMTELNAVKLLRKMQILSIEEKFANYGICGDWTFSLPRGAFQGLDNLSGFFPAEYSYVKRFAKSMIESMQSVDLLGSWANGEGYFENELSSSEICSLRDIEPYYHRDPWTQYLKGKKVLVIHPFASSIQNQYEMHRKALFEDPLVLPEFQLSTLKAIQSIAGNRPEGHKDWFSALNWMFSSALSVDADIVILGCGAYGFPLAAMLKTAGKQVIHLGGCTQILFGIKGGRWDTNPVVSNFYNDYWIRPSREERPASAETVENSCYW